MLVQSRTVETVQTLALRISTHKPARICIHSAPRHARKNGGTLSCTRARRTRSPKRYALSFCALFLRRSGKMTNFTSRLRLLKWYCKKKLCFEKKLSHRPQPCSQREVIQYAIFLQSFYMHISGQLTCMMSPWRRGLPPPRPPPPRDAPGS